MSSLCICNEPVCSCVKDTPAHQQEMMKACETGDVSRLRGLFDAAGVTRGDNATQRAVDPIYHSGPPATSDMIHIAVTHNQPAILRLLLDCYSNADVSQISLLGSECANPDLPTLKVLHSHDPSIVNYAWDEKGLDTLLEDYCRSGDAQLSQFLLENGANPNGAGPPSPTSPLRIAITSDQPPSLISKLIRCGAQVHSIDVMYAMRRRDSEITKLLLRVCRWDDYGTPSDFLENALEDAYQTKDKEIISLMKQCMTNGRARKKWWHIWN